MSDGELSRASTPMEADVDDDFFGGDLLKSSAVRRKTRPRATELAPGEESAPGMPRRPPGVHPSASADGVESDLEG